MFRYLVESRCKSNALKLYLSIKSKIVVRYDVSPHYLQGSWSSSELASTKATIEHSEVRNHVLSDLFLKTYRMFRDIMEVLVLALLRPAESHGCSDVKVKL